MRLGRGENLPVLLVRMPGRTTGALIQGLEARGLSLTAVHSVEAAHAELHARRHPVILFDLCSPVPVTACVLAGDGDSANAPAAHPDETLGHLRELRSLSPASQVVMIVNSDLDLTTCCRAVEMGAASFIDWRGDTDGIDPIIDRINQAYERYETALEEGRDLLDKRVFDEAGLAGQSQAMAKLLFHAKRAAIISDVPVLITGESGTGKQLLAEAVHRMDPKRRNKPFLTVNCAAITGSLAESALFGHRKGAFTGASEERAGYFLAANGGTILLDEVSELEKPLQPKLLRVLQEKLVLPVGADKEKAVDVRIIAACNRPLELMVEQNEFRLDLYQRLNVINLNVPPLRERPEDIPVLMQFFLRRYASDYKHPIEGVDERVYDVLTHSLGCGNVRELENAVRQILVFKRAGNRIELSDIPPGLLQRLSNNRAEDEAAASLASAVEALLATGGRTLPDMVDEFEKMVLREALSRSSSTHTDLATRLGLSRRTLYNKLNRHDLTNLS